MPTIPHPRTSDARALTALVVHESMFHNTAAVAAAVAEGLRLEGVEVGCRPVDEAPPLDEVTADLLVVGAPTHAFSLSRPTTREDAVRQGAPPQVAAYGVREWLGGGHLGRPRLTGAAMFDTRVRKVRHLPKSAATRGRHLLEHLGFEVLRPPEGFLVEDVHGPLADGELARALEWGRGLARTCEDRRALAGLVVPR